jgi:WD40 repeat protein
LDAVTGEGVKVLEGHEQGVLCVGFTSDSRKVVSGGGDRTLRIWDIETGKEVRNVKGVDGVRGLSCSRVARWAFRSQALYIWEGDEQGDLKLFTRLPDGEFAIALSRDGGRVAVGGQDVAVSVWSVPQWSGDPSRVLRGHSDAITSIVFSPDQSRLASGSSDGTVKIWDLTAPADSRKFKVASCVAFSADGGLVAGGTPGGAWVCSTRDGKEVATRGLPPAKPKAGIAFSPDASCLLMAAMLDGDVMVWEFASAKEPTTIGHLEKLPSFLVSS